MFTNPSYLQIFLTISLPIMGIAYALVGGLKLSLVERLQIDEGKVGKLVGGFGTMFGPTILICGFLTDALGRKGVWLAGSACVAAAVLIFALARSFRGALAAVLLLGIGWAAQVNVGNVLMRVAVPADRPPQELVWAANFFDFVFGFGALITPMVLGVMMKKLGYSKGLVALTVVAALPLILGVFAEMNPPAPAAAAPAVTADTPAPPPAPAVQSGATALLSSPLFWVLGFAFLFFVPLETSVAGWATTLIQRQTPTDVPPPEANRFASLSLSAFWFGFTGSRLLVSILGAMGLMTRMLGQANEQRLLFVMAIVCVVIMLCIAFMKGRGSTFALILLAGVACGPVFPTMMAIVLLSVPPDTQGRAVGFFFFFASVGWTVVPMLIGYVARKTDIQKGFLVAAGSGAIFFVLIMIRGMMGGH